MAHDGLSACRRAATREPDLDGWQLCAMLKQHPASRLARIPVVMLSTLARPENIERGLALGAVAYITKPYAVREVLARVRELVDQRRAAERRH